MTRPMTRAALALCAAALLPPPAAAQEPLGPRVSIELNTTETIDGACQMSFLVQNGHPADIESAVYEAVLFDADGRVERLTLFDFGALPAARPRVRQFVVGGLDCAALSRLLFNGAETCAGDGVPAGACIDGLRLTSRTATEILG